MSAYEGEELSEGLFSGFLFLSHLLTGKDHTSQRLLHISSLVKESFIDNVSLLLNRDTLEAQPFRVYPSVFLLVFLCAKEM